MIPILPDRLCWSSAIGNFIINFGMLDYLVFDFLKTHLSPEQFSKIKDEHFQDRIKRLKRYVLQSNYPAESRERFDQFFTRLDPIRDLRNHIAHGHLLVRQDEATKKLVMTLSLPKNMDAAYSPDSRQLTFDELERELSRLTELVEAFKQFTEFKNSSLGG